MMWLCRASADAIPRLAYELRQDSLLLCFDEFQVLDIADAMVIRRLFALLWDLGTVTAYVCVVYVSACVYGF